MPAETVLEASALTKDFRGRRAVESLSFMVGRGEIVGLLGPNGAGKTTVIHMLLGLIRPSSGRVRLFGLDMPRHRQEALGRVNFSSAYAQLPLSLTPRQNLNVYARLYGVRGAGPRAQSLLERMGLASAADRPTRGLSSGQLSRLNLAKALLNDPEILFLDEPTASMDPDVAGRTRELLAEVHRERGTTLVYTSHNMREVESMATRVLFLNEGRLAAEGTPAGLLRLYGAADLEEVFLKISRAPGEGDR